MSLLEPFCGVRLIPAPLRYSQTLLISSLVSPSQEHTLQQAVAAAAVDGDWRVVWCGLESMYRMFTLHDDSSMRNRLYYGLEGLQYSGISRFLPFQEFCLSSEIIEASNWLANYKHFLLCIFCISHARQYRRVREKAVELCLLLIDHCSDENMKLHVLQQLQQRLLDETDARVIAMMIEPNRFKTFCIRIDALAKRHQQQHHDAMHA
jgi:hypothetical protein